MSRAPATRLDRRRFLLSAGSAWAGTFLWEKPGFCSQAEDLPPRALVLIELTGGNDGLSTVVPFRDDAYHRARPTLRLAPNEVLRLDQEHGLHPELKGFERLFHEGHLAIVEGAGYPNPVRSHFHSLEVWHAGDLRGRSLSSGWIGRACESAFAGESSSELAVHFGPRLPFSLYSATRPPIALESPTAYQWFGHEEELEPFCEAEPELSSAEPGGTAPSGREAMLVRLRGVLESAGQSSERIRAAVAAHVPEVEYPRYRFGANLRDIAAIIHAGLGTRVLSTNLATFDTHADQESQHASLLRKLDSSLAAFLADLAQSERGRQTLVLVYSEFGRRLAENASGGTDHGKAGPLFLLGAPVRGGFFGRAPDLGRLEDGDPAFTTDFRCVYATLLDRWLGVSAAQILGREFPLLDLV
jgi:uncharacterized protein (DUF1501 family)